MSEKLDLDALERANLGKVVRPEDWMALLAYARKLEIGSQPGGDAPVSGAEWLSLANEAHAIKSRRESGELLARAIAICQEEGDEWDSDNLITEKNYAHACRDRIAALAATGAGNGESLSPSLSQHDPAALSNVDELVSPAAVRADEVDAEVVNSGVDGFKGNFDAAADADPHGNPRMVDADLHDSSPASGIQGCPVAWRYRTPTGWHATTDAGKAARLKIEHGYEVEALGVLSAPSEEQKA